MMKTKITLILVLCATALAATARTAQKENAPSPQNLEQTRFPQYEVTTLENGLKVFILEHPEQPVISIQLVIAAGGSNDPPHLPGLATFTTGLLKSGTLTRTAQEIAESIEAEGGDISTRAAREAIIISASILKDTSDLALELMTDIVMNPDFSNEEIERMRQQAMSGMISDLTNPDFVADASFIRALYGTHPYGHPAKGTPASLKKISRTDILEFHKTFFVPNTAALVIAGDVTHQEGLAMAQRWFGRWEGHEVPGLDLGQLRPRQEREIYAIDDPNSNQTEIRIGQTIMPRKDEDYFSLLVGSYVLGGPSGRLMNSLRVQRGLTYGAYEVIIPRKGPGAIYAATETRTEKTIEAIEIILEEIDRLKSQRIPEDELEFVKAFLIGSFPLTIETPSDLGSRLANLAVYDLGFDYLNSYRDKLSRISAEDVARVAKEKIRSENVLIVLVGNVAEFQDELEILGNVKTVSLSMLDLDSPTLD